MKLATQRLCLSRFGLHPGQAAFTLPEMLIACTLLTLLVGGIMIAHLFGLRMYQVAESKLNATGGARKSIGKMADEIRTSRTVQVGNVTSNGVFEGLLDGEKQEGGGLLIQTTTNAADYILYFVNAPDQTFRRTTGAPDSTVILARSVTNAVVFQSRDIYESVLTNNQNNRVIHFSLEFYQPQMLMQSADYYKVETSVTRRSSSSP